MSTNCTLMSRKSAQPLQYDMERSTCEVMRRIGKETAYMCPSGGPEL